MFPHYQLYLPGTINNPSGNAPTQNYSALLGDPSKVRTMIDSIRNTPIPALIKNNSQPHYNATQEFSLLPQEKNIPSNIPSGSIVYLSKNGTAQVFDSAGKQILTVDGDKVSEVQTPNGLSRSTQVFEVPNGSIITSKGNATFVIHDNRRILTVISDTNARSGNAVLSFRPDKQSMDRI